MKYKRSITTNGGKYWKVLVTKDFVFYVNYQESDENGAVLMYKRDMTLVSDNYFASVGLNEALDEGKWEYISPTMKYNYKQMKETGESDDPGHECAILMGR